MTPFTIAIDFDGTLSEHRFPDLGAEVPGAFAWLRRWQEAGARLILWTMRGDRTSQGSNDNGPVLSDAVRFCAERGITFYAVNRNPSQESWTISPKVYAHVYIDDAAACCPLIRPLGSRPYVDWNAVGPLVNAMLLEHQRPRYAS